MPRDPDQDHSAIVLSPVSTPKVGRVPTLTRLCSNSIVCVSVLFPQFLGGREIVKRCVGQEKQLREPCV